MKLLIFAILAALCALPFAVFAQEPEPAPLLSINKSATLDAEAGGFAGYRIIAINSGDLAAREVEIRDQLPAGYDWLVIGTSGDIQCSLSATLFLDCFASLPERHLEEQDDGQVIFVNGAASVNIQAYQHTACVSLENRATLRWGDTLLADTAFLIVAGCPTPTPTPTVTATPTATPTATAPPATSTPTATATQPPASTKTPKPPSTGNAEIRHGSNVGLLLFTALGLGTFAFAVGGIAVARRSR